MVRFSGSAHVMGGLKSSRGQASAQPRLKYSEQPMRPGFAGLWIDHPVEGIVSTQSVGDEHVCAKKRIKDGGPVGTYTDAARILLLLELPTQVIGWPGQFRHDVRPG